MIKHLVLVGCGHMGYAMLRPWAEKKAATTITVVTPDLESLHGLQRKGVQHVAFPASLAADAAPDVIMFAVKPQILGEVLKEYRRYTSSLFLSVAAGKTLEFYGQHLGASARVVRAMPNLPAKVGEGATLLVKNASATAPDAQKAEQLLSVLGMTAWLNDESLMDAATALSGCGPAYFYLLADLLGVAGAELGLPQPLAQQLARQTLLGSAALWREDTSPASVLYQNIAVKGGMTESALNALNHNDALKTLLRGALQAAVARGKALAGQ